MKFEKTIQLKDGRTCCLRNGVAEDGAAALECFRLTHMQTDHLLSYADEITMTAEEEGDYLQKKTDSDDEIELVALIDGKIVALGGIDRVGRQEKLRHRAEFGVCVDEAYWGLGIGRAILEANIACAKHAGYLQLELDVVAENARAVQMYRRAGFTEYGRNPNGFLSRSGNMQEVIRMRLEL